VIIAGQEKPSLEELHLEHFGVKGMKWGVVKSKLASAKAPRGKVIRKARRSVNKQERKILRKDIGRIFTVNKAKRAEKKTELAKMKLDLLNDPDRATAARITRGEKVALALFTAPTVVGVAGTAAVLGAATAKRKVIEKRQREGFYTKRAAKK